MDARGQVGDRFKNRALRPERGRGVLGEGRGDRNQRRSKREFCCLQHGRSPIGATEPADGFPARSFGGVGNERWPHRHEASGSYAQASVGAFDGRESGVVAKVVQPLAEDGRRRVHFDFVREALLSGQRARRKAHEVMRNGHGRVVVIDRGMRDFEALSFHLSSPGESRG